MTTKTEIRNFSIGEVEFRAPDDQPKRATGYAAVFASDSHDLGGFVERIAHGAFVRSLAEAAAGTINIHALWSHDNSQPLGSTRSGKLTLSEDGYGLRFDLDIARFTPAQLDALRDGDCQMSFGFIVREQSWLEADDGTVIRTLIDVDLREISLVINPAYPATDAALRSMSEWRSEEMCEVECKNLDITPMLKRALSAIARGSIG